MTNLWKDSGEMTELPFELPYKIFSLNNDSGDNIELVLTDMYDYPNNKIFWGGYEFCGSFKLQIKK